MLISKLEPVPTRKGRWLVYLENGDIIRVTEAELADFSLYTGMELDEQALSELKAAAAVSDIRGRALDLITRRPLSRAELLRKLSGKGAAEDNLVSAADWLETLGLLNDAEYARSIVRHYSGKGFGIYKVKDELYRRGVPKELWEEALTELGDPAEAIHAFLDSRLGGEAERAQLKKCYGTLLRRGFARSDVSEGLRRYDAETQE